MADKSAPTSAFAVRPALREGKLAELRQARTEVMGEVSLALGRRSAAPCLSPREAAVCDLVPALQAAQKMRDTARSQLASGELTNGAALIYRQRGDRAAIVVQRYERLVAARIKAASGTRPQHEP